MEILMLMISLCRTSKGILTPELMFEKMNRTYTHDANMTHDAIKKFYNKEMVIWERNYDYVNIPLSCIAAIILGVQSDRFGRKGILVVGLVSFFLDTLLKILILWEKTDLDIYWFYAAAAIAGILGDSTLLMSGINAFVSDRFKKTTLSFRMVTVSVFFSIGSLCASSITKALMKHFAEIMIMWIVLVLSVVIILIIVIIKDHSVPEEGKSLIYQTVPNVPLLSEYIRDLFGFMIKKRDHYLRCTLYICIFTSFMETFIFGEEKNLIGTYTRLPPFNWKTEEYSTYKLVRPIVQIIGMLGGSVIFFKLFKIKDTIIITLSIISMAVCVLVIGLANSSAGIYVSLPFGALHGFLNPLLYAYIAKIIAGNEIGTAYAVCGIFSKAAGLLQNLILQNIYISTLDWCQAFIWYLLTGLSLILASIFGIVHFVNRNLEI
uniref:MFS domain-containing protein n=1 Tax=Rhabditophanes sp. KR3021 TaxID=114890 RepID=A0AC35UDD2_9BILA